MEDPGKTLIGTQQNIGTASNVFSKHNILGKIKDSVDYFLLNILAGSADILDEQTAIKLKTGLLPHKDDLKKKGYLINSEDEKLIFINSYCEVSEKKEKSPTLIHFIPWFTCNLSCDFCPYKKLHNRDAIASEMILRTFFTYIDTYMADRNKIIAVSGGEPLLPGDTYKDVMTQIFLEAAARGLPVRINTNGYYLHSYLPFFQDKKIEGIHISLDFRHTPFSEESSYKTGNDYFEKLARGIHLSLEYGIKTHVNIFTDTRGIETIHLLASYAEQSGWTDNSLFSVDIQHKSNILLCDTINALFPYPPDMTENLYHHILKYPELLELYLPHFSISRYLFEKNHFPFPLFKACPGGATELVCSFNGKIYPCIAAMIKTDDYFGTFYPEVTALTKTITTWEERDITTIKKCNNCSVQLACGGGCTVKAKEESGKYSAPSCIPVNTYLEAGISLYFDKKLISDPSYNPATG